jgi:hypothetical protein
MIVIDTKYSYEPYAMGHKFDHAIKWLGTDLTTRDIFPPGGELFSLVLSQAAISSPNLIS